MVKSLLGLEAMHAELDEGLIAHQQALLAGDYAVARRRLEHFSCRLELHIAHENDRLLPLYEASEREKSASGVIFRFEHKRLLEHVADFFRRLDAIEEAAEPSRLVIALFDEQAAYKSLTEHHHDREHNVLFPALEAELEDGAKGKLLDELWAEWRAGESVSAN